MKQRIEQLYQLFQRELKEHDGESISSIRKIECCFQICDKYWNELRVEMMGYKFESLVEEIYFFKNIKPLFISELKYYHRLYHAELFMPSEEKVFLRKYWERQLQLIDDFINGNREFYNYYKSGVTNLDNNYFTQQRFKGKPFIALKINFESQELTSSHDHILSSIIAYERFKEYVVERMNGIENF